MDVIWVAMIGAALVSDERMSETPECPAIMKTMPMTTMMRLICQGVAGCPLSPSNQSVSGINRAIREEMTTEMMADDGQQTVQDHHQVRIGLDEGYQMTQIRTRG
jgi:hypothetical protein